jgi:hypothetical protein
MQAVLSSTGSSNYRGRAQHILILQKKVNELQEKLNKVRGESNYSINQDAKNSNGTYLNFYKQYVLLLQIFTVFYYKYTNYNNCLVIIREIEKARQEITDKALKDTQSKVNELTKSLNVSKNRNKSLEVEISVLRNQIQKLLSKAEVDSKTIEQLKVLINIFLFIFINLIEV